VVVDRGSLNTPILDDRSVKKANFAGGWELLRILRLLGGTMPRNIRPVDALRAKKGAEERRRWPRLPIAIPAFVRGSDELGKALLEFATILDIGAGGVLFSSRKQVKPRSRVSLEIPISPLAREEAGQVQTKFEARVLRSISGNGCYSVAAQFKGPLSRARS
jgi:hypothetical protein